MNDRPHRICHWRHAYWFDNIFRPLIHRPERLFAPFVNPGMTVADIGCGMGWATFALGQLVGHSGRVLAVDIQPEMLEVMRRRAKRRGLSDRIVAIQGTAGDLPADNRVGFAVAFWVVHEVGDVHALFEALYGRLDSSGSVLIVEPKGHVSLQDFIAYLKTARNSGFSIQPGPTAAISYTALLRPVGRPGA